MNTSRIINDENDKWNEHQNVTHERNDVWKDKNQQNAAKWTHKKNNQWQKWIKQTSKCMHNEQNDVWIGQKWLKQAAKFIPYHVKWEKNGQTTDAIAKLGTMC